MNERFERLSGFGLRMTLSEPEHELLRALPDELRAVYGETDDADPVRARLFPRAYLDPTAEEAERDWRALVHPELVRERLAALDRVVGSLEAADRRRGEFTLELAVDDVTAWLRVLNDARLALGTRLGVTEETTVDDLDPDDPATPGLAAYAWLTYLEGELVETLLEDLPE